ncbi:MAG TPA: VOC family protein [Thermoanaerobaculia bacterium]|jgi:predicted enzyme related to lactoylglutathione lyase|nr:VOC family protein [Thermoanaerobaculia bacterium]
MAKGIRKAGEFCWINMLTPQPEAAREFFGKMLGWEFGEIPGMGHLIKVGGRPIGGLFDLAAPQTPVGTPPGIGVMVKVESADATCEKVVALGGKAKPAFDIGDRGRMAECFDPNGAEFDLWEPKKGEGTDVDIRLHGAPGWFETITSDTARATKFYGDLFGWTAEDDVRPEFTYTSFKFDGDYVAGMMPILPRMGEIPSHWGVYFTVDDADETARLAGELGAKVFIPAQDIPGIGRFCGIFSPQGVMFYAIRYNG